MPIYDYACTTCDWHGEHQTRIADRHEVYCPVCGGQLTLQISATYGRIAGRVLQGGGPDRFTADMLGTTVKDLPPVLRADYKEPKA